MTTQQDVRDIAKKVRESANDVRLLEVVGMWLTPEDVAGEGDSGAERYKEFAGSSGERVEHVQSQQSARLGTEFDWIIDYYEYYARISETPYAGMNAALQGVLSGLATTAMSFDKDIEARFSLGDWDGGFAENLSENLFSPLDSVPQNQAILVRELQAAVLGHWNLVLAARKAMVNIGTNTKAKLDALIKAASGDPNDAVLPVLGATLAIVGLIPTMGASAGALTVTLAILGAAKATTEAGIAIHKELKEDGITRRNFEINGASSSEIITSMITEIGKLDQLIAQEEKALTDKLEKTIANVEGFRKDTKGGDGRKARAWHLQSYRSELADGLPEAKEMDHVGG